MPSDSSNPNLHAHHRDHPNQRRRGHNPNRAGPPLPQHRSHTAPSPFLALPSPQHATLTPVITP
ncbi:hypothetical protein Aph01nite_08130 [Acrocarpospora phusangensis]|uniref:Uncharacterized protein n=1 Tax=Acrocarpospora phusangensis TaxID=1070424 RepID=A0A919ULP9_9ACTN|nr:hypothetical protein Aph01nite_08130 [Acrocarpospora phusangensis]